MKERMPRFALILAVSFIGLAVAGHLLEGARLNLTIICLLKDLRDDPYLLETSCLSEPSWRQQSQVSLTLEALYHRRSLKAGNYAMDWQFGIDLCPNDSIDARQGLLGNWDPRLRQIIFYRFLDDVQGETMPDVSQCRDYFPSSTYLQFLASGKSVLSNPDFDRQTRLLAYILDRGWTRPLWRVQNAVEQGDEFLEQGKYDLAIGAYQRAVESLPDDSKDYDFYVSHAYRGMAVSNKALGALAEAIRCYELSILASPSSDQSVVQQYVDALYSLNPNSGTSHLTRFIRTNALAEPRLVHDVVTALADNQRVHEASLVLSAFSFQRSPFWLAAAGTVAKGEGRFEDAESLLSEAIALSETVPHRIVANWAARLAVTCILQGDLDGAIQAQELATSLAPESAYYWYDSARYYQARSNFTQARKAISKALSLAPNNGEFRQLYNALNLK